MALPGGPKSGGGGLPSGPGKGKDKTKKKKSFLDRLWNVSVDGHKLKYVVPPWLIADTSFNLLGQVPSAAKGLPGGMVEMGGAWKDFIGGDSSRLATLGQQMNEQYAYLYNPRHPLRSLQRIQNEPLQPFLDALSVATLGGGAAARLGTAGYLGSAGRRLATPGVRSYQLDRGRIVTRPTSANPVTRAIQQGRHRAFTYATDVIERRVGKNIPMGQHRRAVKIEDRRLKRAQSTQMAATLRDFDESFRSLNPVSQIAIVLRAKGLRPSEYVPVLQQWREAAMEDLATARNKVEEVEARNEIKAHERMIGYVTRVTDEMYDNVVGDPKMGAAFAAARDLVEGDAQKLIGAGMLSAQSVADRPYLSVAIIRGAEFMGTEQAARQILDALPARAALKDALLEAITPENAHLIEDTIGEWDRFIKSRAAARSDTPEEYLAALEEEYSKVTQRVSEDESLDPADFGDDALFGELGDAPTEVLMHEATEGPSPEIRAAYQRVARNLVAKHGDVLPEDHATVAKTRKLLLELRQRALEAEVYRRWYKESAEAILEDAGGDVVRAQRLAMLFSIYSPRAAVWDLSEWNNTTRALAALREWEENGVISDTQSMADWQTKAANTAMETGEWTGKGRKTTSFYSNFLKHINEEEWRRVFPEGDRATIDTWMRRAFRYRKRAKKSDASEQQSFDLEGVRKGTEEPISDKMYTFMEDATKAISRELGWEPEEAQAAIWTSIKAEQEGTPLSRAGVSFSEAINDVRLTREAKARQLVFEEAPPGQGNLFETLPRSEPGPEHFERNLTNWVKQNSAKYVAPSDVERLINDAHRAFTEDPDLPGADEFLRLYEGARAPVEQPIPFQSAPDLTPEDARAHFEAIMRRDDFLDLNAEPDPRVPSQRIQTKQLRRRVGKERRVQSVVQEQERRRADRRGPEALFHGEDVQGPYQDKAGQDLEGLPTRPAGSDTEFHSYKVAQDVADAYMREAGLDYTPPTRYVEIEDPPAASGRRATRIAEWYDKAEHNPSDPDVARSYQAFIQETMAQMEAILRTGIDVRASKDYPYQTPRQAVLDVVENNRLVVYPTEGNLDGIPADHPLLGDAGFTDAGGHAWTYNDVFRFVHDYFGHVKEGVGFRASGEENAWRSHSAMYSPEARGAMTTETRGQNSWVNYGPHGKNNRTAKQSGTVYADQKAVLPPEWVIEDGSGRPDDPSIGRYEYKETPTQPRPLRPGERGTIAEWENNRAISRESERPGAFDWMKQDEASGARGGPGRMFSGTEMTDEQWAAYKEGGPRYPGDDSPLEPNFLPDRDDNIDLGAPGWGDLDRAIREADEGSGPPERRGEIGDTEIDMTDFEVAIPGDAHIIPVDEAFTMIPDPDYVYHGTSGALAEKIMAERKLTPGDVRGEGEAFAWLADNPKYAAGFAQNAALREGGNAVVIAIPRSAVPASAIRHEGLGGTYGSPTFASPEDVLFQRLKGAYERPKDGAPARITYASGIKVDTPLHEFWHDVRENMTLSEQKRLAKWAGAKPIKDENGRITGYDWTREAEENVAEAGIWAQMQDPGQLGAFLRHEYGDGDNFNLLDLPPRHILNALNRARSPKEQGGQVLRGGTHTIEQIRQDLNDLFYHPDVGVRLRENEVPGARSGATPPAKPGLLKMNRGIRLRLSRWLPSPRAWRDSHIRIMSYFHARERGEFAYSIGRDLGPGLTKNDGWYFVRLSNSTNRGKNPQPQRRHAEEGGLDEEYRKFDEEHDGDLETHLEDNIASRSAQNAQRWIDEGSQVRQISPADYKRIFGEYHQANKFIKKYFDNPTNFWRTLTLTYRPAWVVNNFVGQSFLYAVNHAGRGGGKAYAQAVLDSMRREDTLPDELKYSGFIRTEGGGAASMGKMGTLSSFEAKWRNRIQRLNAELSDNIPRNAAYKSMLNKISRTQGDMAELAKLVKDGKLDITDPRAKVLHDQIIEDVLGQLIDFADLSNFERTYLRRVFPFYSWIKGITKATGKLVEEHPARILVLYQLGVLGDKESQERFGKGAAGVLEGFVPFGERRGKLQSGIATTGLNPLSTVASVTGGAESLGSATASPLDNPFLQMNPAIQALVETASKSRLFSGAKYKESQIEHLAKALGIAFPQAQLIDNLLNPKDGDTKLSPQRRLDLVLRYLGIPLTQRNLETADSLAAKQEAGK